MHAIAGAAMVAALPFVPSLGRKEWGGRLVLAGKQQEPGLWYMSKICTMDDWVPDPFWTKPKSDQYGIPFWVVTDSAEAIDA